MNIFAQAAAGKPLTPAQRATLKLIEGFFLAGLVAAVQVFAQYLSPDGYIDWPNVIHTAAIAGAVATLMAIAKYYKSHGDPLLATVATTAAQSLEPTLYNRAEAGTAPAPSTTSNPTGDAATVAVVSTDAPAAA